MMGEPTKPRETPVSLKGLYDAPTTQGNGHTGLPKVPSPNEIARFLEVVEALSRFEAQQRTIRGYGAFKTEDMPVPEVVAVLRWLNHVARELMPLPAPLTQGDGHTAGRTRLYVRRDPITHELKTWEPWFQLIVDGVKNFEWRRDRDFQSGDTLRLRETIYGKEGYTGRETTRVVTYVLRDTPILGLPEGYAVLSFNPPATSMPAFEAMKGALAPFAAFELPSNIPDRDLLMKYGTRPITAGNLRRAREAYRAALAASGG